MAVWWIFFMSFLTSFLGILRLFSVIIDCLWMAPRTPDVIVMSGLTFHPLVRSVWMRGLYLLVFVCMALLGNLSWQYVNSMSCIVFCDVGVMGGLSSTGAPMIHRMSGLSRVVHVQGVTGHAHWSSQSGVVLSWGRKCLFPAFTSV